jgi:hypothetical protein
VQKNCNIKPKIRRKAKKSPDIWRGQHQALKVQQALISLTQEIIIRKDFSRGTQKRIFQTFPRRQSIRRMPRLRVFVLKQASPPLRKKRNGGDAIYNSILLRNFYTQQV